MIRPANTGIGHRDVKPAKSIHGVTVDVRDRAPSPRGRRLLDLLVDLIDKPDLPAAPTPREADRP